MRLTLRWLPGVESRVLGWGALGACVTLACAKDVVLADLERSAVCGDGVVQSGEQCDTQSPGCVDCVVAPDWTCRNNVCSPVCGDGVVGTGTTCTDLHRDTDCDMTGYWAARETHYERDSIVGSVQTSSNWFLFHFSQTGDVFEVAESLDCGIHVTGTVTVDYTPASLRAILYLNRMDAQGTHGPRKGTSKAGNGGCDVSLDRWYNIRGGTGDLLPPDFSTRPALTTLPPLPTVTDPVTSTDVPSGATDPDGDGIPGMAFAVTGFVTGTRNSVQRDWKEYATPAGTSVPAAALAFAVPGGFDLQESVLRVTDCGTSCALLKLLAQAAGDLPGRIAFSFIGKTYGSPRVAAVVAGVPGQDVSVDLTTCANVRLLLPHDPSVTASSADF
jgi:hypothetical protein